MANFDLYIDVANNVTDISNFSWYFHNNNDNVKLSWTKHNSLNSVHITGPYNSNFDFNIFVSDYDITNADYDKEMGDYYDKTQYKIKDGQINLTGTLVSTINGSYNKITVKGLKAKTTGVNDYSGTYYVTSGNIYKDSFTINTNDPNNAIINLISSKNKFFKLDTDKPIKIYRNKNHISTDFTISDNLLLKSFNYDDSELIVKQNIQNDCTNLSITVPKYEDNSNSGTKYVFNLIGVDSSSEVPTIDTEPQEALKGSDTQKTENFSGVTIYEPQELSGQVSTNYTNSIWFSADNNDKYDWSNVYYVTDVNRTPQALSKNNYGYYSTNVFTSDDWSKLTILVITDKNGKPLENLTIKPLVYTGNATTDNDHVKTSVSENIITFIPDENYKITAIDLPPVQAYPGGPMTSYSDDQVKINLTDLTATILDYDIASNDLEFSVTTENTTPKTYDISIKLDGENATIDNSGFNKVEPNTKLTLNINANDGYYLTHVKFNNYIDTDLDKQTSYNLSFTPTEDELKANDFTLTVTTEKIPPKVYTLTINKDTSGENYNFTPKTFNITKFPFTAEITVTADDDYNLQYASIDRKEKLNFSANYTTVKEVDEKQHSITFNLEISETDFNKYDYRISAQTYKVEKKIDLKVDYDTKFTTGNLNKNIVTIQTLDNYTINSLKPYVYQPWAGSGHTYLDDSCININDDKKNATITVPDDYLYMMYTLVVNGDYTDNTPTPETNKGTDSIEIYTLTDSQLNKLSQQAIIRADSKGYSFSDFFKQLYRLPFHIPDSESTGTTNIKAGIYNLDVSARKLEKEHYILDLGKIKVVGDNNNGFDYNISSIKLYLPFISERSLDINDVINKTISITYDVNLLDGRTSIIIKSNDKIISSGITDISTQLELFSIYSNKVVNTLKSTLANSIRQAYIKVEYNKPVPNLVSYETNEHGTIKNYKGYIQGINMQGLGSLDSDTQNSIKAILNGGIFINGTESD